MQESNERLKYLFQQFASSNCTKEELEELYRIVDQTGDEEIHALMDSRYGVIKDGTNAGKIDWEYMFNHIVEQKNTTRSRKIIMWRRIMAAAAIVTIVAATSYIFLNKGSDNNIAKKEPATPSVNDLPPGGNKAVLTLADNSTIILDNAANGELTQQGNTKVLKLDDGQLSYNTNGQSGEILYNTISTPRGGQYHVVLPDGSRVWLNAASSLRFPTAFTGNDRKIEITGEAYFEIAKNKNKPFKVSVNDMNIEVLGTHFNVMAYADEAATQTTLLEGAVKVYRDNAIAMLAPGTQAQMNKEGKIKVNKNIDIQEVVAWKNGMFHFTSLSLDNIMRQISRWYDVDVSYKGEISKETFSGIVSRNSNVSQVLKIMEQAGVRFKIEGKKITIL